MKKSFFFVAALALTFAACQPSYDVEDKTVATFEEAAISPKAANSELIFPNDTIAFLKSGIYELQQTVSWGGMSVSGAVITNHTDTTFRGYADAYKSVAGGARAGKNYCVWYYNVWGMEPDVIKLAQATTVPGVYICNSIYAYNSMKYGDMTAGGPFTEGDFLLLTIGGSLEGREVNNTVKFYLGKDEDLVTDWTYVDLSALGKIDELHFSMTGSRTDPVYGLNSPAYFCMDNLGAKK